uniref:Uncharacterized protein n=1 Tax=Gracilaria salicornia TaxID=172968 RepID=W8DX63_9FLOR|nr:hypothetical protein [Gracilaria salicornia]AHH24519.1 hypothetical protein [Gracilaria salicornia]
MIAFVIIFCIEFIFSLPIIELLGI